MPPTRLISDDDDAGDGVALARTSRRRPSRRRSRPRAAIVVAALAGLVVGDQAGVEVGVDRHLLAGHGVEGEAGGDLGDAPGALGDDHELDDHEDQEDDEADDDVAADDELPNASMTLPASPCEQDQPRGRDVERQPEQRRDQQQRREDRELQRLAACTSTTSTISERGRDVDRDQHVEQERAAAARPSSRRRSRPTTAIATSRVLQEAVRGRPRGLGAPDRGGGAAQAQLSAPAAAGRGRRRRGPRRRRRSSRPGSRCPTSAGGVEARASGGFSTIAMPCSRATSRDRARDAVGALRDHAAAPRGPCA